MNRSSIVSLLIGILAALTGFWAYDLLRKRSCTDVGAAWDAARRACVVPAGVDPGTVAPGIMTYVLPIVLGIGVAFTLTRIYMVMSGRGPRAR